ncbi:hypothetical protein F5B19DRAFT_286811 [Rostrohypoxylon terebratum]|nr:hypothetical protein F5B19DRAFT_286811 [Rostrohypoxylon terebratum]
MNAQKKPTMKPTPTAQAQARRSLPSSSAPRGKGSSQTPPAKPGKTVSTPIPTSAPKPGPHRSRSSYDSIPKNQYPGRPLEAASILSNPRLQQVTGLLPRKAARWNGMRPPIDELIRLQWVMSLPDQYPVKRPKGNF